METYKPENPPKENASQPDSENPAKKNQDDPNRLQKPGGVKEKYVPQPGIKSPDEDNPGRDYDKQSEE